NEASVNSRMINQLLFGEAMGVLVEAAGGWLKIKGDLDGFEGWVAGAQTERVDVKQVRRAHVSILTPMTVQPFSLIKTDTASMVLPFGASLLGVNIFPDSPVMPFMDLSGHVGNLNYTFIRNKSTKKLKGSLSEVDSLARLWRGAPYLEGGRTMMGVDGSGFV